ncbi:ROK family protein [Paeniglutamicibacter kerguelensis]|uniref:Glucokinase n=1 Tax=Paeniglutamicibacter kerguelensis TaxID=254788 RepID=A0ABS4XGC2_9MICC|nr:ROK family protein [Paeniglutamicibacter kerguelensis]MBP2387438.1 glucokinase [Paeniglutamicibacter kerguelensis]
MNKATAQMRPEESGRIAAFGIDLGGTKIAAGLIDTEGSVLASASVPTPATEGAEAVLDAVAGLVDALGAAPEAAGLRIRGLGMGAAGVIDAGNARVLSATDTILHWAGTDLSAGLLARTGLAVRAVNDVHAHGLGEAWCGAAAGKANALLLAVGTGIGGSHLLGGVPQTGAHHVGGHMGHFASPLATGVRCSCGRTGHLEAIAAGPAIHRNYLRLGGDPYVADTRELTALAHAGDLLAIQTLRTGGRAAGIAAGSLANILDPELIVFSGGMTGAGDLWWDAVREGFAAEAIDPLQQLELVPATLGNDAALIGAAGLFLAPQTSKD